MLEVVLALALLVGAVGVITSALSSSVLAVENLRLEAAASDMAVTAVSELQMGLRALESVGPIDVVTTTTTATATGTGAEEPAEWTIRVEVLPMREGLEERLRQLDQGGKPRTNRNTSDAKSTDPAEADDPLADGAADDPTGDSKPTEQPKGVKRPTLKRVEVTIQNKMRPQIIRRMTMVVGR